MSDEHSEEFLRGYQRALADAAEAIRIIDQKMTSTGNPALTFVASPLLDAARIRVTTLEPGFISPANGHPTRS